ncbi:Phosphatidylinositol-3-phosphatase SAC1 [Thecaphora frezii]
MYADREEARNSRRSNGGYRSSHSPELEIEKRPSKHENGEADRGFGERERELQEQLRRRAMASRGNGDGPAPDARVSRSRSPRSTPRSVSRSRSRDSYRSRRSHASRPHSTKADDEADERRRRRREERDAYESRSRRRDRGPEDDDEEERARERRRRRSERDDYDGDRDREIDRDRDHRSSGRRGDDAYGGSGRHDHDRERDRDRYGGYYADRERERDRDRYYDRGDRDGYGGRRGPIDDDRRSRSRRHGRYDSPVRSVRSHRSPSPPGREIEEYEERSVFCSQLAARLTQRDLGEFFEEHLGEGTVKDVRIVMDRVTRRSRGVGYVEFADKELVPKAMALSGTQIYGMPILVQRTDAARNRGESGNPDMPHRPNMPPPSVLPPIDPAAIANLPLPPQYPAAGMGAPIHLNFGNFGGPRPQKPGPGHPNAEARLYVGSLHFSLTDENVKAVFEPFGEVEYVDLHREAITGKSKGFAFVQFKEAEDAKKALEQMNGFELAGRTIRVGPVNARGSGGGQQLGSGPGHPGGPAGPGGPGGPQGPGGPGISGGPGAPGVPRGAVTGANSGPLGGGNLPTVTSAYDDGGGAGLNPDKRAALMQKLARTDSPAQNPAPPAEQQRPASIPDATTTSLLLKNMFDPAEETERDWDLDLAEDVKEECQSKYGPVTAIHVEKESAGEIYITFADTESSSKAMAGLNGRWFGGKPISAQ